jgi:hypothetical protein
MYTSLRRLERYFSKKVITQNRQVELMQETNHVTCGLH